MRTIKVDFNGYISDKDKKQLPEYCGIYLVYSFRCNLMTFTYEPEKLIYIGQSDDVQKRLSEHEKHDDFVKECGMLGKLYYAYAKVDKKDLDIVENALVFIQKPVLNDKLVDNYNHETCHFIISGKCDLLNNKDFTCQGE